MIHSLVEVFMDEPSSNLKSPNAVWHHATIGRNHHESLNGHKGAILWFTGLSGAGKSTLAHAVEEKLYEMDVTVSVSSLSQNSQNPQNPNIFHAQY